MGNLARVYTATPGRVENDIINRIEKKRKTGSALVLLKIIIFSSFLRV